MTRQQFRKCGHEYLLPYASLFIFISILIPVTPVLGYKPVRFIVTDLNGKPLEGAIVTLETIDTIFILPPTNETGITQSIDPIPQGAYRATVKWKSQYRNDFSLIFSDNIQIGEPYIFELKTNVFPLNIKLVTPGGITLSEIPIYLNGYFVGSTGQDGILYIPQIPAGSYRMNATWLDVEIGPGSLEIGQGGTQVITARNVAQASILVIGAQGQKLDHALVKITRGNTTLLYVTDEQGTVVAELPIGNYTVMINYGQFKANGTLRVPSTVNIFVLDIFIELLGVGMSMAQFLLFIVMIEVIVIVLAIVVHEYEIYRKRKLRELWEKEEMIETKPPSKGVKQSPKKSDKKHLEKVKASFTIRQLFTLILLSVLFSLSLSAILVIGMNIIMGVGFTLRETAEKILNLFPSIATIITGPIITYIYIRTRKE